MLDKRDLTERLKRAIAIAKEYQAEKKYRKKKKTMKDNINSKYIGNRKFIIELRYEALASMLDKVTIQRFP